MGIWGPQLSTSSRILRCKTIGFEYSLHNLDRQNEFRLTNQLGRRSRGNGTQNVVETTNGKISKKRFQGNSQNRHVFPGAGGFGVVGLVAGIYDHGKIMSCIAVKDSCLGSQKDWDNQDMWTGFPLPDGQTCPLEPDLMKLLN